MKPVRIVSALLVLLLAAPAASAHINEFSGTWKNVDPETGGLTTLLIDVRGARVRIQAWGKCHPRDCAWGHAEGTAYAPSVSDNLAETAQVVSTLYITSFSQTILVIRPAEGGQLEVEMMTKFTDQSGRASYRRVERFGRAVSVAGLRNTLRRRPFAVACEAADSFESVRGVYGGEVFP